MSAYFFYLRAFHPHSTLLVRKGLVTLTPFPAVQFPWLPVLALLGVPVVVIVVWILEHTLFATAAFGWDAFAELVLPLGACIFATIVFLVPNPMHALLSLLGVFFTSVMFYLAAGIAFVGLVFLIVYVGAVAVLFLFVIMLLSVKSLTAQERLVRHATQGLAMVGAVILFHQLHIRVLNALGQSVTSDHLRDAVIESTTGDAIAFYVRYQASDINILTGLYTVHSPTFLVTTIILLSALMGAIILATVTTERSTTLADIRKYVVRVPTVAIVLPFLAPLVTSSHTVTYVLSDLTSSLELLGVTFMSLYSEYDRRDLTLRANLNKEDYTRYKSKKPYEESISMVNVRWMLRFKNGKPRVYKRAKRNRRGDVKKYYYRFYEKDYHFLGCGYPLALMHTSDRWDKKKTALIAKKGRDYAELLYVKLAGKRTLVASAAVRATNYRYLDWNKIVLFRRQLRWHWRPERATSLMRIDKEEVEDEYEWPEGMRPKSEPLWTWEFDSGVSDPFNVFTLGPFGYAHYIWVTQALPFVHYWAWRVHAFCVAFFGLMIFFPLVLVPVPWFLNDYDIAWSDLKALHTQVYAFITRYVLYTPGFDWFKEILTLATLYPAAALKTVLAYPFEMLGIAAVYAYDAVLFTGGDFARAELHEATCKHFRVRADTSREFFGQPTEEELARRRRHPDKGRTDLSLLLLSTAVDSVVPAAAPCPFSWGKIYKQVDSALWSVTYTPDWWRELWVDTRLPLTIVGCVLIPLALAYAFSGIILGLGWKRIYGPATRISISWHIIVLLITLYVWRVFYYGMMYVYLAFDLGEMFNFSRSDMSIEWRFALAFYMYLFAVPLVPYFLYRSRFVRYEIFEQYRQIVLRRFVNYYLHRVGSELTSRYGGLLDKALAIPLEEAQASIDAKVALRDQVAEKKKRDRRKPKYVFYKKPKKVRYDFDPHVRVRRSETHPYAKTPLTEWDL